MIGWADWDALAARLAGLPRMGGARAGLPNEERYAIVKDGAVAWARVSPNPDVPVQLSGGRFYDTGDPKDHPEGAVEWCRASAKLEKQRIHALTSRVDP